MEQNHFSNFGKRAEEEHVCEIGPLPYEMSFKDFPIFSSGGQNEQNHLSSLGKGA